MIDQKNFKDLLKTLDFVEEGNIFTVTIDKIALTVNFAEESIGYPEKNGLKVNERQICNFSANENFVVFECVHRLLKKGYKPAHLELEPRWKVGHGVSGGRADILVKDQQNKPLLLIECKTGGGVNLKRNGKTCKETAVNCSVMYSKYLKRSFCACMRRILSMEG